MQLLVLTVGVHKEEAEEVLSGKLGRADDCGRGGALRRAARTLRRCCPSSSQRSVAAMRAHVLLLSLALLCCCLQLPYLALAAPTADATRRDRRDVARADAAATADDDDDDDDIDVDLTSSAAAAAAPALSDGPNNYAMDDEEDSDRVSVIKYLLRYGYLSTRSPNDEQLENAVAQLQEVLGLTVSGMIDSATVNGIKTRRCAARDVVRVETRKKRFALAQSSRWSNDHFIAENQLRLKWFISRYTRDIPKATVRSQVIKGFELWAKQSSFHHLQHTSLIFEEATSEDKADIVIMWAEGDHGDEYKFDGTNVPNNVLAHTFYPDYKVNTRLNGDIHFDDAEKWDMDPDNHVDTFFPYVLAHEIGHALGLQHSKRDEALMHPVYKNTPLNDITLSVDDKCGINWNYVGPSHFCLFVWLMSEIVPLNTSNGIMVQPDRLEHTVRARTKNSLKNARIPRCQPSNNVQSVTAERLIKNLHFSADEAQKYSQIACNFLAGLHVYRGSSVASPDDSIETEFSSVREFADDPSGVRRLVRRVERKERRGVRTVMSPEHFTRHFYDRFFKEYFGLDTM